ncbi:hypothetical protein [Bradyrhizobium sp. WD16]|nr:hypothetical protein [Bradyrhizobium sp. WD16]
MLARPEWNVSVAERKNAGPRLYLLAVFVLFSLFVLGDVYVMWTVLRAL